MRHGSTSLGLLLRGVCAVTLGLLTAALSAQAPKPELVKDINTTPLVPSGSNPNPSRTLPGNVYDGGFLRRLPNVYFAATTIKYGTEPFMSNGTATGAVMLGDINPGPEGSNSGEFTLSSDGRKLFFRATDGKTGNELWVCDLTASPPKCSLVVDLYAGSPSSNPTYICALGNKVVFEATTPATGYELFVSDGTAAGTTLLKDILPGRSGGYPRYMKTSIKGDKAFFYANDGLAGYEPWVTDGTPTGTKMVRDIYPGSSPSYPNAFQDIGDSTTTKMVFMANDGNNGQELWISDGTPTNTKLIKDVYPGFASGSYSYYSTVVGGKLYFRGNDGMSGYEIWETDGTAAGTKRVFDVYPGSGSGYFYYPVVAGGKIFFRATNGTSGYELWVHDPAATTNPTHMVKDIWAGVTSGNPTYLAPTLTGKVFFSANDGPHGYELWVSDGTAAGTTMVKDIYPGSSSGSAYYIAETTPGRVVFRSSDGKTGNELWASLGTSTSTVRIPLESPVTKTLSAGVSFIAEMNGKVYFSANDGKSGYELWSSDGTAAGTKMVKDINPGSGSGYAYYCTRLGNKILFSGFTSATGQELWETDGTAAGTKILKDLVPGSGSSSPTYFQRIGDKVYFSANSGQGYELHVTDGTAAGTRQVADLNPGPGTSYAYFSRAQLPNGLICVGHVSTPTQGYEMAVTDGTAAGTKILDLVKGSGSSYPRFMTAYKGKVYFSANLGSGYELCVTDGTVAGTKMVTDLYPGTASSYWYYLISDGKLLYGRVNGPNNGGYELWASDGTAAGTKRLADVYPGSGSSYAQYHTPVGSRHVYFAANDGKIGYELFRWDGSNVKSWDIWPGTGSSYPYNFVESRYEFETMHGQVYFRANDGIVGYELFRLDNGATATNRYPDCSNIVLSGTDPLINSMAKVELSNPNATPLNVLLFSTASPAPFTLPGGTCPVFLNPGTMGVTGVSVKANTSFSLPIPNDKALEGGNLVFQAVDLQGFPVKFGTSNPLMWTLSAR